MKQSLAAWAVRLNATIGRLWRKNSKQIIWKIFKINVNRVVGFFACLFFPLGEPRAEQKQLLNCWKGRWLPGEPCVSEVEESRAGSAWAGGEGARYQPFGCQRLGKKAYFINIQICVCI